jgi:hypothetical protein
MINRRLMQMTLIGILQHQKGWRHSPLSCNCSWCCLKIQGAEFSDHWNMLQCSQHADWKQYECCFSTGLFYFLDRGINEGTENGKVLLLSTSLLGALLSLANTLLTYMERHFYNLQVGPIHDWLTDWFDSKELGTTWEATLELPSCNMAKFPVGSNSSHLHRFHICIGILPASYPVGNVELFTQAYSSWSVKLTNHPQSKAEVNLHMPP